MTRRFLLPRAALAAAAALSLAAPAAGAQAPTATPTPAPVAGQNPEPAPPASGRLYLKAERVMRDGPRRVALQGASWRVSGEVRPYLPGQTVEVRFFRNRRRVAVRREHPVPVRGGSAGAFRTPFRSGRPGRVRVQAVHVASPELVKLRSRSVRVEVMRPRIGPGQRGPLVRLLQRGLARLHYAVPRSGGYDAATQRAVMAWRKVSGFARNYSASPPVIRRVLAGRGNFRVRHPRDGHHVEADLSRQVLALIDRGRVRRIYHISSGAPATPTVLGRFRVYRKDAGTNAKGMVHSSYFVGGYAMHGYASVPPYNASHGCLRLPIPDAWRIFNWIRYGDVVWVYP